MPRRKGSSRYNVLLLARNLFSKCRRCCPVAALAMAIFFGPSSDAFGYHTGSASCPLALPPTSDPAGRQVQLTVKSVRLNSDMEGGDEYIPFYDNRADVFGNIKIEVTDFHLPEIEDSNFPHWPATQGVFVKDVAATVVPLSIDIWENDGGATGDDDHVDVNPAAGNYSLDFNFDLCSLRVTGDVNGSTQDDLVVSGGGADDAGTIRFRVEPAGGRPATVDDLALVEVDLLQVIHQSSRLVAGKPTVAMVRIANNYGYPVSTNLRIRIVGSGGFLYANDVFPVTIGSGELQKLYLFRATPLIFPASPSGYDVLVSATLEDPGSARLPDGDCRRANDSNGRTPTKVVTTRQDFSFLWMKVGTLLDIGNYTPDSHFQQIYELGRSFIEATYPLASPPTSVSPIPLSPPLSAALDWLVTVLSPFGIPADVMEPYALVYELDKVAVLSGHDRIMGVLPNKDWFNRFSFLEGVAGLSLVEFAPHAVIFLPREEWEGILGVSMASPAHELGHTFGLSVDPTRKSSALCDFDWPVVGSIPCAIAYGFEEYGDSTALTPGNPARGYWIPQGVEPASISALLDQEQCDSHCFMGITNANDFLTWTMSKTWIDDADYEHLIDKLQTHPDPEVIHVSGMISGWDEVYIDSWYRIPEGIPDRVEKDGLYLLRFLDEEGRVLQDTGLPLNWNLPETRTVIPITFFSMKVPFPEATRTVEIWNRGTGKKLTTRTVSAHPPEVRLVAPTEGPPSEKAPLQVSWHGSDEDGDALTYTVLISPDQRTWWPAAHGLTAEQHQIDQALLKPARYFVKVIASDGVNSGESNIVEFYGGSAR